MIYTLLIRNKYKRILNIDKKLLHLKGYNIILQRVENLVNYLN